MHFRCVFTLLLCYVLVGLDWAEPMMYLNLHVICSCIFMHTYPSCFYVLILNLFGAFLIVSFSLSLSYVSCIMTSKHKSIPSQNPLRFRASSSFTPSDPTPSHVWFYDEKAKSDFSKNFSRQGIHSERQVILSDFSNTDLTIVIYNRGWQSLCGVSVTCPFVIIQEFYSNMHIFDYSIPLFVTHVRGIRMVVTPNIVSKVLHVPRVAHPNYPSCECLRTISKDKLASLFYETLSS